MSYQKLRRSAAESDEDEQGEFYDEIKKGARNGCHSSVYRSNQEICPNQAEPRAARKPRGTQPSVELSGQRAWTCLLGRLPKTVMASSLSLRNSSLPITQKISF